MILPTYSVTVFPLPTYSLRQPRSLGKCADWKQHVVPPLLRLRRDGIAKTDALNSLRDKGESMLAETRRLPNGVG